MAESIIKRGNNMPVQAPLVPDPFVPYYCKNNRTVYAICRGDKKTIKKYLAPTPFEYITDLFMVSISDYHNCDKVPFMDCCLIFPVRYKAIVGGYFMFEYEDNDSAIAAGRELWGYPKKYADATLVEKNGKIVGTVIRKGKTIMKVVCDLNKPLPSIPSITVTPHINIHSVPNPDGPGSFLTRVLTRDTSPDFKLISEKFGQTKVTLTTIPGDPLGDLQPKEVLGGGYKVGDFAATEEHGWGYVIATL